jgi:hypothetical protein
MLDVAPADTGGVIHRALVLVALAASLLLLASFGMFARDQLAGASKNQQNQLVAGAQQTRPTPSRPVAQPRRFIDGAAQKLTSPFASLVQSDSPWATKGLPTVIALVVYGVGIGFLARFSRGLA